MISIIQNVYFYTPKSISNEFRRLYITSLSLNNTGLNFNSFQNWQLIENITMAIIGSQGLTCNLVIKIYQTGFNNINNNTINVLISTQSIYSTSKTF